MRSELDDDENFLYSASKYYVNDIHLNLFQQYDSISLEIGAIAYQKKPAVIQISRGKRIAHMLVFRLTPHKSPDFWSNICVFSNI